MSKLSCTRESYLVQCRYNKGGWLPWKRFHPPQRNTPIRHYAILTLNGVDLDGIATQVPGGYSFQADGETRRRLVSYRDVHLTLLGRCDLADAQRQADEAAGGFAALVCGYAR